MGEPTELIELEGGADAAALLLTKYDRQSGAWLVEKDSEFWAAVETAHLQGRIGHGKSIAIVDSAFDSTVAALARSAPAAADDGPTSHGTAVALLVKEVAPAATIRLFPAAVHGRLQQDRVLAAIEECIRERVDILNLSMGIGLAAKAVAGGFSGRGELDPDDWRNAFDIPVGPLWTAVRKAVGAGITVIASAGNHADHVFVPAAVPGVVSVGFQHVRREVRDGSETAVALEPSFSQSVGQDTTLLQPPDALGSSFACPLIAGFAALMADRRQLPAFLRCSRRAAAASWLQVQLAAGAADLKESLQVAYSLFQGALAAAPHDHFTSPGRTVECPECTLFCAAAYINFGLLTARSGNPGAGRVLLQAARNFAPTNPHAAANLAVVHAWFANEAKKSGEPDQVCQLLAAAARHMSAAVRLRPEQEIYRSRLAEFHAALDDPAQWTFTEQGDKVETNQIRLRMDTTEDLEAARAAARANGVDIREVTPPPSGELDTQVEPVTAVLVGTAVVAGVKMILDWWERRKGGLVIDLRPDAPDMFYRDKDLSYGFIATIPADGGKVTLDVKDVPDAAEKFVKEVVNGTLTSLSSIADAAKSAAGEKKVAVEPA